MNIDKAMNAYAKKYMATIPRPKGKKMATVSSLGSRFYADPLSPARFTAGTTITYSGESYVATTVDAKPALVHSSEVLGKIDGLLQTIRSRA